MRFLAPLLLAATALLAACGPTPKPVPTDVSGGIKTIGVIVAPWDSIPASHLGLTIFTNEGHVYSATEWKLADMLTAALREALEPRYRVVAVPAVPVDQDDYRGSSYSWRIRTIVAPSVAAAPTRADAYIFVDMFELTDPILASERKYMGCGLIDMASMFSGKHMTRLYCLGSLDVLDPASLEPVGHTMLSTETNDMALTQIMPDFDWQSAELTPAQIEAARRAIAQALQARMPALVKQLGLQP
ncbi:MAG: hypothetical protein OJI70_04765 [Zavarzinia sp.]|nr:hypothetical protein [Zavarzinia sp.]